MEKNGKPVDMVKTTLTLFRVLYIPGGFPDFWTIKSIITIIHIGKDGKKQYQSWMHVWMDNVPQILRGAL